MANARCSGIKADGTACRGIPIHGSQWCVAHHPDYQEERRKGSRKGGRRGGRGRPLAEVAHLKELLGTLTGRVISEDGTEHLSPAAGAVAAQLLNTHLRAIELERKIREQDELLERIEELERSQESRGGSKRWGA